MLFVFTIAPFSFFYLGPAAAVALAPTYAALLVAAASLILAGVFLVQDNIAGCSAALGTAFAALGVALFKVVSVTSEFFGLLLGIGVFGTGPSVISGRICK